MVFYRSAVFTARAKLDMLHSHVPRTAHIPVRRRNFFYALVYATTSARTSEAAPIRRHRPQILIRISKTLTGCGGRVVARYRSRLITAIPLSWDCATSTIPLSPHGCRLIRRRWLGCAIAYLVVVSREPRFCNPCRRRLAACSTDKIGLATTRPPRNAKTCTLECRLDSLVPTVLLLMRYVRAKKRTTRCRQTHSP